MGKRRFWWFWMLWAVILALFAGMVFIGSVEISAADVWASLMGSGNVDASSAMIVRQVRVPMALTALLAGAGLSIAGLLLQTAFDNPLAGPSILGVSTGASLGVAVVMLGLGGVLGGGAMAYLGQVVGALGGAAVVLLLLLGFSSVVRGQGMLLIVGILLGYLATSAISLLNFFSTQQGVHSYVIWGLGTFAGLPPGRVAVFAGIVVPVMAGSFLMVKPLNALLLGKDYAASMGVNTQGALRMLLTLSGVLTAVVTAFCGPIGFVGLMVPHIARMFTGSANHRTLLPATALSGAAIGLLCAFLSVWLGNGGIIPVNAITPVISIPVIIYVILRKA